jgi:hypothetical protein
MGGSFKSGCKRFGWRLNVRERPADQHRTHDRNTPENDWRWRADRFSFVRAQIGVCPQSVIAILDHYDAPPIP